MKILIDSSVWIEYFSDGPRAKGLEKFLKPPHKIVLPAIVSYEVYKKVRLARNESMAVSLLAQMERLSDSIVPMDQALAVRSADISLQYNIPMADAIIYSTALANGATLVTMDRHFIDMPDVQFVK